MLKIDCNFSWHGNQVVTAWSTATVLYMYGCEQLHNEGPFSCRNLYLDCCRIAAVMFSLTLQVFFLLTLEFGDNLSSDALQQVSLPQDRTLVGDDDDEDEVVINHSEITRNPQGDDIPFTSDGGDAGNLTPSVNRDTLVQFEEERPDTGIHEHFLLCKLIEF